jgi:hypothetical protein
MRNTLAEFQLRLFCQTLAKISPNDKFSFPFLWQQKELLKVRAPVDDVFQKLKILFDDGNPIHIFANLEKLSSVLNEAIEQRQQIDLGL